ncbi:MAG: NADPH-dependent oxidoreductase [Methylacidiphilales bacterium]|nr:NADPH-dependent oxidoreductase [Candidatus Methylacidiphilales bacterium]
MRNSSTFPTASTLLQERYRSNEKDLSEPWDETISLLLSHRSIRSYLPKALPPGTVETLVAAAQSASTSSNLQTWSVIAVEDPERKARLSVLAGSQKHIVEAPLFLVWIADLSLLQSIAESMKVAVESLNYVEYLIMAVVDATLAAQNAFIALESLGLGGVYIGAIRNNTQLVATELGLPSKAFPVFGLTVGFPDPSIVTDIKPRLPQAAVLHREQYTAAGIPAAVAEYDGLMRQFQAKQKLEIVDWSRQAVDRIRLLTGRDHLAEDLHKLGFPLR